MASITALAALASVALDLSERFAGWSRPRERFQLDELPGMLLVVAIGACWFAFRRYAEARRELQARRAAEQALSAAVAENRRLIQRALSIQETERRMIARELHDELGQHLLAIRLDAEALRRADPRSAEPDHSVQAGCARRDPAAEKSLRMDRILAGIAAMQSLIGDLIRQLRPVGLDELGLAAALEHCVDTWRERQPGTRIQLAVEGEVDRIGEEAKLALFRVAQEALVNASRHAGATAIDVRISRPAKGDGIEMSIADNGCGADPAEARRAGHGTGTTGVGLLGLRERMESLGGRLDIATARGAGFRVAAWLPSAETA